MGYELNRMRASLVAWMRWHAANKEEIERAPDQCRLFLEAMSKASGVQAVAMLASEIEREPEVRRLTAALTTIERSGAPGAVIVAKRTDGHSCSWCRGMLTPCPVETARLALHPKVRTGTGIPGERDPDSPCADFRPGKTSYGRCDGDGHYLCDECAEHSTPVDDGGGHGR